MRSIPILSWIIGICGLLIAVLLGISIGTVRIPMGDIFSVLMGRMDGIPESWILILMNVRIPRVLAAILVGGALATGGVACQGIFRNPLSEPYLLGISSGAALGASLAIIFLPSGDAGGLGIVGILAFIGALTVTGGVFLAAGRAAFRLPSTLLLSGIAIAFLGQAVIWLLMTLNRDQVVRITFWTLGSLSAASWPKVIWLAAITIPSSMVLAGLGRILDVLSTGYESAYGIGLKPQRAAAIILLLTTLSTAASVAVVGIIGFVGLMVPHIMRLAAGPGHRGLMLRSWIGGAAMLVFSDLVARTIHPPGEIPIGIVTALLGAPFLLVMIRSGSRVGRLDG